MSEGEAPAPAASEPTEDTETPTDNKTPEKSEPQIVTGTVERWTASKGEIENATIHILGLTSLFPHKRFRLSQARHRWR